jgi:hypothetical protein
MGCEILKALDIPDCLAILEGLLLKELSEVARSDIGQSFRLKPKHLLMALGGQLSCQENPCDMLDTAMTDSEAAFKRIQVATKADDAEMPVALWNDRIRGFTNQKIRDNFLKHLRTLALRWWRRNVIRSFMRWFKNKYPSMKVSDGVRPIDHFNIPKILRHKTASKDWAAGRECIWRCSGASWWEWDLGSRPFHWRWSKEYQEIIQDGLPWWYSSSPPHYVKPQRVESDEQLRIAIKAKLSKV